MQLNYIGRFRSLYQFYNLLNTDAKRKANIILGRLTDNWGSSIPVFDPSKSFFYKADGTTLDGVPAGNKCSDVLLPVALLVSPRQPAAGSGITPTEIAYNGQTYYGIPLTKANAQVLDTGGYPFLSLYLEFNLKVAAAGSEFTFRQIGFHDSDSNICATNEVFAYENVHPQTVNAAEGLTLKLILSF